MSREEFNQFIKTATHEELAAYQKWQVQELARIQKLNAESDERIEKLKLERLGLLAIREALSVKIDNL
jgi:hypothetical protein